MNLEAFNRKRQVIDRSLSKICSVAEEFNSKNLVGTVKASLEGLRQDKFNIVVVGEFSRGKSTFINALLGKRVLPAATKPTTTMINKITYGERHKFILYFREGKSFKEVDETEFYQTVAEREPDYEDEQEVEQYKNRVNWLRSIAYADIKYPLDICKEGIEIIDTPGTNDLDTNREEITFNFLPKADVAILLLSATQPLSKSELQFLKERIIGNQIKNIFFVINFKDKLNDQAEEEKVINYVREQLETVLPKPKMFLVSGKQALNLKRQANGEVVKGLIYSDLSETGFTDFETQVSDYLINERANIKLQKYVDRGNLFISEILKSIIQVRLNAAGLTAKQLEQKVNEAKPHFEKTKATAKKIIEELKVSLRSLETDFITSYKNDLDKIAYEARLAVSNYDGELDVNLISQTIESKVAPLQKTMYEKLETYKRKTIGFEIEKTNKKISKIWNDMRCKFSGALVPVTATNEKDRVAIQKVNDDTDGAEALIMGGLAIAAINIPFIVIPAAFFFGEDLVSFFKNKKREKFLSKIKQQVDASYRDQIPKKVAKFQEIYAQTIADLVLNIEKQINNRVDDLERQLNGLLEDKRRKEENLQKEVERLNKCKTELLSLKTTLNGVL